MEFLAVHFFHFLELWAGGTDPRILYIIRSKWSVTAIYPGERAPFVRPTGGY